MVQPLTRVCVSSQSRSKVARQKSAPPNDVAVRPHCKVEEPGMWNRALPQGIEEWETVDVMAELIWAELCT